MRGTFPSTPFAPRPPAFTRSRRARRSSGSIRSARRRPEIFLKLEIFQPIGSFKIRGAMNAVVAAAAVARCADGVWTVSAGNAAQGVALAAREAGRARLGARHGGRAGDQAHRDRTARRHHRQGLVRRMLAGGRAARVRSDDRPARASVRRRRLHQRQRHGRRSRSSKTCRTSTRSSRRSAAADCWPASACVMRALRPDGAASTPPSRRTRRRSSTSFAAGTRRCGSRAGAARWSMAPAASRCCRRCGRCSRPLGRRVDRRAARRRGAGDEARRRALPRHRRRRRRVRGRRRAVAADRGRAATGGLSPSSPAATSISHVSRRSSAPAPDPHSVASRRSHSLHSTDGTTHRSWLPARLARLPELAYDLWWTWNPAREVFRRLDYGLWRQTAHNPVMMLQRIDAGRARARRRRSRVPRALRRGARRARRRARAGGSAARWWHDALGADPTQVVAYFCAEFALHQSLPIYAGGLGVLAGDHCKEASDLGVPLVGVGFMYPQGYFRQRISPEGWQQEVYEQLNWADAPIDARADASTTSRASCSCRSARRSVLVQVWEVRLGRVRLLLLDTDLEQNAPWDRELSARLYGGGQDTRLQQEIVLGLGGVLALRALGLHAGGVAPERRPRGVRRAAAPARLPRRRARPGTTRSPKCGARPSSRRTRRCRPVTTRSRSTWSSSTWRLLGIDERPRRAVPRARPLRQRATARSST